jgi:hypothetical protein
MRLDPEVRKQVEGRLKRRVPEPDEPEFYQLLEELRVRDPEVAALLEEGIQFEQVKPPEEEVKVEVKKRALLRDLANRLFRRYDELTGEWVPSRPKQILWGVTAFMAIPVLMWGLGNLGGPKAKPAQAQPAQAKTVQATTPQGVQPPTVEAPEEPTPPGSPSGAPEAPGQTQAPGQGQPQSGASSASPANPQATEEAIPPPPTPAVGGEVPPPPQTSGYAASGAYTAQAPQEVAGPPLAVYVAGQGAQAALQAVPLQAYARQVGQGQGENQSQPGMGGAIQAQAAQAPSMTAYRAEGQREAGQVPPMASFVAYRAAPAPASPAPASPPPQAQGGQLDYFAQALPDIFGPPSGAQGQAAQAPQGQSPSQAAQRQASPQAPQGQTASQASPYLPGTRVPGRLAVKLVVPEGEEVPVAVETEDGAVVLGKARLSPTRRVDLVLDQVVLAGRAFPVRAVALGADMAQGLPAQVREEAPSLVADLVRGSLRGLSDYVRARSQQTTITTTPGGGTVVQQGQTPPLELFLGAAAADLFTVPQGTRAVVRVAEVAEGTPLTVLVLGQ